MRTMDVTSMNQITPALQARVFPIFDRRTNVDGASINITGLWELDDGSFAIDVGNVNHDLHLAYIDDRILEIVLTDLKFIATYTHDDILGGKIVGDVNVIKRHSFVNVFEATEYFSKVSVVRRIQPLLHKK